MQRDPVTIETIGGGALGELFETELRRILENIADPNTDSKSKRVMSIQIAFKPSRDRDVADVELKCSSKLAGINSVSSTLYMGRYQGKLIAVENDPRQQALFDQQAPAPLAAVANFEKRSE